MLNRKQLFAVTSAPFHSISSSWLSLNILLDQGGERAKLGDFGFALDMPQHECGRTLVTAPIIAQTNGYSPPEVQSGKFSPKSDMYSYGIVRTDPYNSNTFMSVTILYKTFRLRWKCTLG